MAWQKLARTVALPDALAQMDLRLSQVKIDGNHAHLGAVSARLRPAEAKMLAALLAAGGECVPAAQLLASFRPQGAHACPQLLSVHICLLRKAIGPLGLNIIAHVKTDYSLGFIDKAGA